MKKMNPEMRSYLSDIKNYETFLQLNEAFENFKNELLNEFSSELQIALKNHPKFSGWKMEDNGSNNFVRKNGNDGVMWFSHSNDEKQNFVFIIFNRERTIDYGIWFEVDDVSEISRFGGIDKIIEDANKKKFADDDWNITRVDKVNRNSLSTFIISYSRIKPFKDSKTPALLHFKNLMPDNIKETAKDFADKIANDFKKDVQDFIIKYSKI